MYIFKGVSYLFTSAVFIPIGCHSCCLAWKATRRLNQLKILKVKKSTGLQSELSQDIEQHYALILCRISCKHIWNNSYVNCGGRSKWRMIIAVNICSSHMNNYFIYASRHFTPHGRYELSKIDLAPNVWLHSSVGVEHRTGIAEVTGSNPVEALIFFQASFQLLKLENLLRWSLFTLIYNRSTNMNYFI